MKNFGRFLLLTIISLGYFLTVEQYIPNEWKFPINFIVIPIFLGSVGEVFLTGRLWQKVSITSLIPIIWAIFLHDYGNDPYAALDWLVILSWVFFVSFGVIMSYGVTRISKKLQLKNST